MKSSSQESTGLLSTRGYRFGGADENMRIPMTPEAKLQWDKECREADRVLSSMPLNKSELNEDTDKFAFLGKKPRTPEEKQKSKQSWENNKEYYRQKHREWYYRNREEAIAKQRVRNRKRAQREKAISKAATSETAKEKISDTNSIVGEKEKVNA